jgi:hypothetical protein
VAAVAVPSAIVVPALVNRDMLMLPTVIGDASVSVSKPITPVRVDAANLSIQADVSNDVSTVPA